MKAKYVISALALPLIFGACSNEDLITENANTALNGNMIELPQNFTLVGKKTAPAETRSEMMTWGKQNVLAWVPNVTVKANLTADKQNWDQIGLAWLNETPGNKVYTNYRFQHYGWLDIDETSAEIDECTDDKKLKMEFILQVMLVNSSLGMVLVNKMLPLLTTVLILNLQQIILQQLA